MALHVHTTFCLYIYSLGNIFEMKKIYRNADPISCCQLLGMELGVGRKKMQLGKGNVRDPCKDEIVLCIFCGSGYTNK